MLQLLHVPRGSAALPRVDSLAIGAQCSGCCDSGYLHIRGKVIYDPHGYDPNPVFASPALIAIFVSLFRHMFL
jgi:hypothetical protein